MTQLLISVTNVEEAKIALEHGADVIDLKDPTKGALGALPLVRIQEVIDFIRASDYGKQKLTSATIGDLPMEPALIIAQVIKLRNTNVDIIKIGFFPVEDFQPCLVALKDLAKSGIKLIAVLFAEYHYPGDLLMAIKDAGLYGVMIDTAKKNGATFFDFFLESDMKKLIKKAQACDLVFGLAGSLTLQHVVAVKKLNPTYIGFRGGVCDANKRKLPINADKISAIRKLM